MADLLLWFFLRLAFLYDSPSIRRIRSAGREQRRLRGSRSPLWKRGRPQTFEMRNMNYVERG